MSLSSLVGRVKIQTTSKNSQRYYTTNPLIRDLLSNTSNCYVSAGEFRAGPLESKCRVLFVLVLGIICALRDAVGK